MRVLFVAPEVEGLPKLNTWEEIDQIGDMSGIVLDILAGKNVTRQRVATRLKQPRDVVVFAGHGEPGKFIVSDGCLTARWLAQYTKNAGPDVVLLASCNSAGHSSRTLTSLAEEISGAGISVIAMPTAVDDDAAVVYDIEFVRALSNGADLREAHQIAQEQMETLADHCQIPALFPGLNATVVNSEERMMERFDDLGRQMLGMGNRMDRMLSEQGNQAERIGRVEKKLVKLLNGGGRH